MAETTHTPKMFPKFIQIAFKPDNSNLYALDENGDIYRREYWGHDEVRWVRQVGRDDDES